MKDNYTQKEIGDKIGWNRNKLAGYIRLLNEIVADVLDLAKEHQKGRVTEIVANATYNFTEGWLRSVDIYDLNKENQLKFIKWFCEEQKCNVSKKKLKEKAEE